MSQTLLGASELEAQKALGTFIDILTMIEENRIDDENPDAVNLYQKLFGDDAN